MRLVPPLGLCLPLVRAPRGSSWWLVQIGNIFFAMLCSVVRVGGFMLGKRFGATSNSGGCFSITVLRLFYGGCFVVIFGRFSGCFATILCSLLDAPSGCFAVAAILMFHGVEVSISWTQLYLVI
jgi:hypothetical protein